jgi:dsRNA-specific ribonuclease
MSPDWQALIICYIVVPPPEINVASRSLISIYPKYEVLEFLGNACHRLLELNLFL